MTRVNPWGRKVGGEKPQNAFGRQVEESPPGTRVNAWGRRVSADGGPIEVSETRYVNLWGREIAEGESGAVTRVRRQRSPFGGMVDVSERMEDVRAQEAREAADAVRETHIKEALAGWHITATGCGLAQAKDYAEAVATRIDREVTERGEPRERFFDRMHEQIRWQSQQPRAKKATAAATEQRSGKPSGKPRMVRIIEGK